MQQIQSKALAVGLAGLIVVGVANAKSSQVEQTFEVDSGGTLTVDSDSGSINIVSHNRDVVEVAVTKKGRNAEDFEVSFEQNGDDVRVTGDRKNRYWGGNQSVKFTIKVPQEYNLDLKTGGGSIEIADLRGEVEARTSGGSISLGQIKGDVDVKTSGGSITVEDVAGNIRGHTSGGSIKATLSEQPGDNCRLTTSGGSITAYLPASIAIDIDASTSGGRVSSDFDIDGRVKKTSIRGTINGGGPRLDLKTSGGSVRIKRD